MAIAGSFMKLLPKKNLDKITVKDIVKECGITRQTFYYHFQDIMDLMEWVVSQKVNDALQTSLQIDDAEHALKNFLTHAMDNQEISKQLLHSQKREQVEKLLAQAIKTYLKGMAEAKGLLENVSRQELSMALEFYAFGIVGIMIDLSQKKQIDIDLVARQILKLLTKPLFQPDV